MADELPNLSDWMATLRCPVLGDVHLSHAWKQPSHIPEVVNGFGQVYPPARRWIVIKLDGMATDMWYGLNRPPVLSVREVRERFASTRSAAANLLNKLGEPHVRRAIHMAHLRRQQTGQGAGAVESGSLLDAIDTVLRFIEDSADDISRDPQLYFASFGQSRRLNGRQSLERCLLWEPLLDLMHDFGIKDFNEHQGLAQTVRALHRALGIGPPDRNRLKQVVFDWRKRG